MDDTRTGRVTMSLVGEYDVRYLIEVSDDLLEWHPLITGTAVNGRWETNVAVTPDAPVQFYRARRMD